MSKMSKNEKDSNKKEKDSHKKELSVIWVTHKKKKTTRTYSIDDSLYKEFSKIVSEKMYNRSKIIESMIKDWVKENKN